MLVIEDEVRRAGDRHRREDRVAQIWLEIGEIRRIWPKVVQIWLGDRRCGRSSRGTAVARDLAGDHRGTMEVMQIWSIVGFGASGARRRKATGRTTALDLGETAEGNGVRERRRHDCAARQRAAEGKIGTKKRERKRNCNLLADMLLHLLHHPHVAPTCSSLFQPNSHINGRSPSKTLFLPPPLGFSPSFKGLHLRPPSSGGGRTWRVSSSLLEAPVLWAGRLCIFYVLLKAGLAGSPSNPFTSAELGSGDGGDDLGFSKWIEMLKGGSDNKEATDRRKLVSKWHPTTKGTLRRNYRVPSKAEGKRLLKSIAALLSEDDHFVDATSHKGCQIRRESAHGESVCCNNVRALFDELPTPHLIVEITAFPAGPLTDNDYLKAEKLERVLRSGSSI